MSIESNKIVCFGLWEQLKSSLERLDYETQNEVTKKIIREISSRPKEAQER